MPSKNIVKQYAADSYYHVYNRGVNRRKIFIDERDFIVFLSLLKRYLGEETKHDRSGRPYPNYNKQIDLLAYCLMPNHFHLLVFQNDSSEAMTSLMRGLCTSYTMYFNRKYNRVGHLFQDRFKASLISDDTYLQHISRYIHLNPKEYRSYRWSSLRAYLGEVEFDWLKPGCIIADFKQDEYLRFLADYEGHKAMLDVLKYELADSKYDYYNN